MPNTQTAQIFTGTVTDMDVLVVDDQSLSREVLSEALRPLGCRIKQSSGGTEALAELNIRQYPLMFVDLMMPGMDGYELVHAIRRMEAEKHRPPATIIAYSGNLYAEQGKLVGLEQQRLTEQGFDDGMAKPFTIETLQSIIDTRFPQGAPVVEERQPEPQTKPQNVLAEASTMWHVAPLYNQPMSKSPFTRALILDDDRFMLMTSQAQIQRHIPHVDIADTPEKALALFCQAPYHLLVLDLEMPTIDGFQMAQKFRLLEAATPHRTCMIALSGHLAGSDILMKCAISGMDDCIAKPLDPIKFKDRLDLWQKGTFPASKLLKK